jgi:hypothetical protein
MNGLDLGCATSDIEMGDQSHAFPVAQTQGFAVVGNDGIAKQRNVDHVV